MCRCETCGSIEHPRAVILCGRRLFPALTFLFAVLAVPVTLTAQTRPASIISDRHRAIDDSVQQLFDEVGRLRLTTGQTLGSVLARAADDEEAVRSAIAQKHQAWRSYRQPRGRTRNRHLDTRFKS